jgi:hypothetical protein
LGSDLKDRLHFFAHYDYEREPKTSIWNTPYPQVQRRAARSGNGQDGRHAAGLSVVVKHAADGKDHRRRALAAVHRGNTSHPAATGSTLETNREYAVQFTQVVSNRAVNEINGGKTRWIFANANLTTWSKHWQAANGVTTGSPRITFSNFAIGGNTFYRASARRTTGACATTSPTRMTRAAATT